MNDNKHRCFCELAPLYVLDLLGIEDRLWVEDRVVDCPDLAEELANYQAAVSLMPYSAAPVPMAADLKDRLFARLELEPIDSTTVTEPEISPELLADRQIFALRSAELQWFPLHAAGMEFAMLFDDPIQRMRSVVIRSVAGVVYPRHRHDLTEEIYMLEGKLEINGKTYSAGDYIRSAPGSIHISETVTVCKFLIRACMDDEYF